MFGIGAGYSNAGRPYQIPMLQMQAPNPWMRLGTKGAQGLFSLLGGKSWGEKKREDLFGYLDSIKGKPLINPNAVNQFVPQIEQSIVPFLNKINRESSRAVGLRSGVATGEAMQAAHAGLSAKMLPIMQMIMEMNARAPLDISRLQAGLVQ